MPYTITWEDRGVYKKFYGFITVAEFHQATELQHGDHRFADVRYVINDFLEITGYERLDVIEPALANVASKIQDVYESRMGVRIAIVTTDDLIDTFGRYFASSEFMHCRMEIFPTVAQARAWLKGELLSS